MWNVPEKKYKALLTEIPEGELLTLVKNKKRPVTVLPTVHQGKSHHTKNKIKKTGFNQVKNLEACIVVWRNYN